MGPAGFASRVTSCIGANKLSGKALRVYEQLFVEKIDFECSLLVHGEHANAESRGSRK